MPTENGGKQTQRLLVEQQAHRLAMSYLTSRSDLQLIPEMRYSNISDYQIDFLVRIIRMGLVHESNVAVERILGLEHKSDIIVERKLGIEVKGSLGAPAQVHVAQFNTKVTVDGNDFNWVKYGLLYPLCLLTFNVRTNQAYFRWIIEPTFYGNQATAGQPRGWNLQFSSPFRSAGLTYFPEGKVEELNQQTFDRLIEITAAWYDLIDDLLEDHPNG